MTASTLATAFAPATVSNVACGFDVLGFALGDAGCAPGDRVTARRVPAPGVRVVSVTGGPGTGAERLPTETLRNTAGVAALRLLEHVAPGDGVEIEIEKRMPFGSGLGSSAASAVAAAVAVNEALGRPLTRDALLPFALDGEAVASGGRHADNVAPCLLGGFVLVRSVRPLDVVRLPVPAGLHVAVVHPHVEVLTSEARAALSPTVALGQMVEQTANLGALVAALFTGDVDLLRRSLHDAVVEPQRAHLVPRFQAIRSAAVAAGALGCSLSGSGPSVFALCASRSEADRAGAAMQDALAGTAPSTLYVSAVNALGAVVER